MAVETSADLLGQLRDEVGFDVSGGDATLLGWLNGAHRLMVARSKCYRRRTVIVGGTVANQADYDLPSDVLEIHEVDVAGVRFGRASRGEVVDAGNSQALFVSQFGEGVIAQGAANAGEETLTIYPTPDTGGLEIALFGPVRAPELTVSGVGGAGATNSPVVPAEFFAPLVHKAAATGLKRTESRQNEASGYDQEFSDACDELRRWARRRWNTGPSRVHIAWPA